MNTKFTLYLFLFCLVPFFGVAQTAEIFFVNNNSGAASLDLQVIVSSEDTIYSTYEGIDFLEAIPVFEVPANTILELKYLVAGTTTQYASQKNAVFSPGEFRVSIFMGTSTSKTFSSFTGAKQSSASDKVRYEFIHATPTLEDIDLIVRETSEILADNFEYRDKTSFGQEILAADYILDITPYLNNNNGLFAYQWKAANLGGDYVFLFTSGTGAANDMYMAELDGTVTQLLFADPLVSSVSDLGNSDLLQVYPNPTSDFISLQSSASDLQNSQTQIYNLAGQLLLSSTSTAIDLSHFENGIYLLQTKIEDRFYHKKIQVQKF